MDPVTEKTNLDEVDCVQYAICSNFEEIVKFFHERKFPMNFCVNIKNAVSNSNEYLVKILLEKGWENIQHKNHTHEFCEKINQIKVECLLPEIFRILVESGCPLEISDLANFLYNDEIWCYTWKFFTEKNEQTKKSAVEFVKNYRKENGNSILHSCVFFDGVDEEVKTVSEIIDVNCVNSEGNSALHLCLPKYLFFFLKNIPEVNVNLQNFQGSTPLMEICRNSMQNYNLSEFQEAVKALVEAGADVNVIEISGASATDILAIKSAESSITEYLDLFLQQTSKTLVKSENVFTAIFNKRLLNIKTFEVLFKHGFSLNSKFHKRHKDEFPPFFHFFYICQTFSEIDKEGKILKLFVENGTNVKETFKGQTILGCAFSSKYFSHSLIPKILGYFSADDIVDESTKDTVVHSLLKNGGYELLEFVTQNLAPKGISSLVLRFTRYPPSFLNNFAHPLPSSRKKLRKHRKSGWVS